MTVVVVVVVPDSSGSGELFVLLFKLFWLFVICRRSSALNEATLDSISDCECLREVVFEPAQNPRWFSPLPLEHLLQLKALDRNLPLPLRNRGGESGDLGQARVGRARRDHC